METKETAKKSGDLREGLLVFFVTIFFADLIGCSFFGFILFLRHGNIMAYIETVGPICVIVMAACVGAMIAVSLLFTKEKEEKTKEAMNEKAKTRKFMETAREKINELSPDERGYVYCIVGFPETNPSMYDVKQIHITNLSLGFLVKATFYESEKAARMALYSTYEKGGKSKKE